LIHFLRFLTAVTRPIENPARRRSGWDSWIPGQTSGLPGMTSESTPFLSAVEEPAARGLIGLQEYA
jgi:hypothetical protein